MLDADELIVDSFAGGGGASLGITWATGRAPDIAINHDENAIEMHAANHPDTVHVLEDVWRTDLRALVNGRRVGLLWLSPDCFLAGTLILTQRGLVAIESIKVGDLVLTHKSRWRTVVSSMCHQAQTVCVKGHGHYGLVTTPNHAFYSKRITTRYPNNKKPNGKRVAPVRKVENPYWPTASSMVDKLWATPHLFPESEIPTCRAEFSAEFFYWVGRYIGDGSLNKGDVEVSCGVAEVDAFKAAMTRAPLKHSDGTAIGFRVNRQGSSERVIWGSQSLVDWLRKNFGDYCHEKRIPFWCFAMQRTWREALLSGYVDADGCDEKANVTAVRTVSKQLAIGIRLLACSLGFAPCMYLSPGGPMTIEGRNCISRDAYIVKWRKNLQAETVFRDGSHLFSPVRDVSDAGVQLVYSLQVDEDESFVADGIVVHNCKHFSRAKGGKPVEKNIRSLAWIACKWAEQVQPRMIFLENVREFAEWSPLVPRLVCGNCGWKGTEGQAKLLRVRRKCPACECRQLRVTEDMVPDPTRKGLTFRRFVGRLRNLGYHVEWRNLDAAEYGAPTHRKRLFLIARCDGQPIAWPEPTHGKSGLPYRTAAECIDWSIVCPSIFDRKRPLAEKTLRRIALGIQRYVLQSARPFIVQTSHTGTTGRGKYAWSEEEPLRTLSQRSEFGVVAPVLSKFHGSKSSGDSRCKQLELPFNTLDTQPRFALLAPHLVAVGHGERTGQAGRAMDAESRWGRSQARDTMHS